MSSLNFNLRGIPSEVMNLLKQEAKRLRTSVNSLLLKMIEQKLGLTSKRTIHHDLDHLAGSWSSADEIIFNEHTASSEKIDEEL